LRGGIKNCSKINNFILDAFTKSAAKIILPFFAAFYCIGVITFFIWFLVFVVGCALVRRDGLPLQAQDR
jgi:hypothetical protein